MPSSQEKPRDLWTDEEFILAHGQDAQRSPWPFRLGNLERPGWTGRIPTYLIWCEPCKVRPNRGFTVAHLAGYGRRLECGSCGRRYDHLLPSRRAKDAVLNPHHHPWLLAFLILAAILAAMALH
ncbi:MAG TPA: hypothetical protein VL283_05805 [Candidatus Baltobacteraceae bacterium]|nr:hypothetical protein [Candidatus Baltobacteraceae bacterium]